MSPDARSRIHWHAHAKYLQPWIEVATRGLSDDSRTRVLEEITAHVEDAIEEGRRRGLSDVEAARRAVEDLGSARDARRAFRRTYLTAFQDRNLRSFRAWPRSLTFVFALAAALAAWQLVADGSKFDVDWFVRAASGLGLVVALTVVTRVVPDLYRRGYERRAVAIGTVANFFLWACYLVVFGGGFRTIRRTMIFVVILAFAMLTYLPILMKLRNEPVSVGPRAGKGTERPSM